MFCLTKRIGALGLLMIVGLAGCGGGGSSIAGPDDDSGSSPPADANLELSRDTIELEELGQQGQLIASVGSQQTRKPDLHIRQETRWLEERPVLAQQALQAGDIRAHGPGQAHVEVRAFGKGPQTVVVIVKPRQPLGLNIEADTPITAGQQVRVRGYRMDDLDGGGKLGGQPVEGTVQDSATLTFQAPDLQCQGAGHALVELEGASFPDPLRVPRERANVADISPGDTLIFTAESRPCLQLPAETGEYGLAYLDVDAIDNARNGRESGPGTNFQETYNNDEVAGTYDVQIRQQVQSLAEGRASLQASTDVDVDTTPPDVRLSINADRSSANACADDDFRYPCPGFSSRNRPWKLGDTFMMTGERTKNGERITGEAEIVRLADNDNLAVALFLPDSTHWTPELQDQFDRALELLETEGYPYFRQAIFPDVRRPRTCQGCGQTLLILQDGGGRALAFASITKGSRSTSSWISMDITASWSKEYLTHTLVHEVAHQYNHQYLWEARSSGGELDFGNPTLWADEGSAEFHASQVVRRFLGVELDANTDRWHDSGDQWSQRMSESVFGNEGRFTAGYSNAQGFMRSLAERMVRQGTSPEEALREVAQGSLEGWYGYDNWGARRTGLTRRMREHFRSGWSPAPSMLTWALSQGGDDQYDHTDFQNFGFFEAGQGRGWTPQTELRVGQGRVSFQDHARYGSVRYVRMTDTNGWGGTYQIEAANTREPVQWMLIRHR